jgi:hypothetical protein
MCRFKDKGSLGSIVFGIHRTVSLQCVAKPCHSLLHGRDNSTTWHMLSSSPKFPSVGAASAGAALVAPALAVQKAAPQTWAAFAIGTTNTTCTIEVRSRVDITPLDCWS